MGETAEETAAEIKQIVSDGLVNTERLAKSITLLKVKTFIMERSAETPSNSLLRELENWLDDELLKLE